MKGRKKFKSKDEFLAYLRDIDPTKTKGDRDFKHLNQIFSSVTLGYGKESKHKDQDSDFSKGKKILPPGVR